MARRPVNFLTPLPQLGGRSIFDFRGQPYGPTGAPFVPGQSPGLYPGAPKGKVIKGPTGRPFVPFKPLTAGELPPGSYDVGLDANRRAAQRGLGYLEQDTRTADTRGSDDLQTGLASILQGRGYAQENRDISTRNLGTQFKNLRIGQYQAARLAGVARGGALAQSFAKRSANQAVAQGDIERTLSRANQGFDSQQSELALNYQRGVDDRQANLTRSRDETAFMGTDTDAAKMQQAGQSGFAFPVAPGNEHVSPGGTSYRTIKRPGKRALFELPSGYRTRIRPK